MHPPKTGKNATYKSKYYLINSNIYPNKNNNIATFQD